MFQVVPCMRRNPLGARPRRPDRADELVDARGERQAAAATPSGGARWALWVNAARDPRLRRVEWPEVGVTVGVPKQVAVLPVALLVQSLGGAAPPSQRRSATGAPAVGAPGSGGPSSSSVARCDETAGAGGGDGGNAGRNGTSLVPLGGVVEVSLLAPPPAPCRGGGWVVRVLRPAADTSELTVVQYPLGSGTAVAGAAASGPLVGGAAAEPAGGAGQGSDAGGAAPLTLSWRVPDHVLVPGTGAVAVPDQDPHCDGDRGGEGTDATALEEDLRSEQGRLGGGGAAARAAAGAVQERPRVAWWSAAESRWSEEGIRCAQAGGQGTGRFCIAGARHANVNTGSFKLAPTL